MLCLSNSLLALSSGTLSTSQVSVTHLKSRHPEMKSTGAGSSNDLQ